MIIIGYPVDRLRWLDKQTAIYTQILWKIAYWKMAPVLHFIENPPIGDGGDVGGSGVSKMRPVSASDVCGILLRNGIQFGRSSTDFPLHT